MHLTMLWFRNYTAIKICQHVCICTYVYVCVRIMYVCVCISMYVFILCMYVYVCVLCKYNMCTIFFNLKSLA